MALTLDQAVAVAGYYPQLASAVVKRAVGERPVVAHFVHAETTFDDHEVRRHMTVLILTDATLIKVHIDDGAGHQPDGAHEAHAVVESVLLSAVTSVSVTYVVHHPENFADNDVPSEVVLAVGTGVHSRVQLEPAACPDPECEADHGYMGEILRDDVMVRVSAIADGVDSVQALEDFAARVHGAVGE